MLRVSESGVVNRSVWMMAAFRPVTPNPNNLIAPGNSFR